MPVYRGSVKSKLKFKRMAPQFYRRKHKNRPKLPKGCDEIKKDLDDANILKKYGYTLSGNSKFYVDTILRPNHSFCVFKSQGVIDIIKDRIDINNRCYLLDGTFQCVAKPFMQLLTISVQFKNNVSCIYQYKYLIHFQMIDFVVFILHDIDIPAILRFDDV